MSNKFASPTAFAALNSLQKQAAGLPEAIGGFRSVRDSEAGRGIGDIVKGFGESALGNLDAATTRALAPARATVAGVKNIFGDATAAKNQSYNADQALARSQQLAADKGYNRATGTVDAATSRMAKPIAMGIAALGGGSAALDNQRTASDQVIAEADEQRRTGMLPGTGAAPTQAAAAPAPAAAKFVGPPAPAAAAPAAKFVGPPAPAPAAAAAPNPFTFTAPKGVMGGVGPAAAPAAAPAAPAAPASTGGPTAEQIAQFQKGTASKFNPNSWLDRNKMQAMQSGGKNWADNSAARAMGR